MIRYVQTSVLRQYCDQFLSNCWACMTTPITVAEVNAVLDARAENLHLDTPAPKWLVATPRHREAERRKTVDKIAWFARNGFQEPIQVDVGAPFLCSYVSWMVVDGNHRMASAIVRQELRGEDPWLPVSVSGQVSYAKELGLWGKARRPALPKQRKQDDIATLGHMSDAIRQFAKDTRK